VRGAIAEHEAARHGVVRQAARIDAGSVEL